MDSFVEYIMGANYVFDAEMIVRLIFVAIIIEFIGIIGKSFNRW